VLAKVVRRNAQRAVDLMVWDRALGQQMDEMFLDDLRSAEEITIAGFRQRSRFHRIAERAANLLTRLL
jgi:hypothetical protein